MNRFSKLPVRLKGDRAIGFEEHHWVAPLISILGSSRSLPRAAIDAAISQGQAGGTVAGKIGFERLGVTRMVLYGTMTCILIPYTNTHLVLTSSFSQSFFLGLC